MLFCKRVQKQWAVQVLEPKCCWMLPFPNSCFVMAGTSGFAFPGWLQHWRKLKRLSMKLCKIIGKRWKKSYFTVGMYLSCFWQPNTRWWSRLVTSPACHWAIALGRGETGPPHVQRRSLMFLPKKSKGIQRILKVVTSRSFFGLMFFNLRVFEEKTTHSF